MKNLTHRKTTVSTTCSSFVGIYKTYRFIATLVMKTPTKLARVLIFSLSIAFVNAQTAIDNEPANNDVPGDVLTLPANNNATLTNSSDIDIFRVSVPANGVLIISVTGTNANMKTRVELINPDRTTSEGFRDANFASADVSLEILTKTTGNYFIKILNMNLTSNPSPYNLSVSMDVSDTYEYNDEFDSLSIVSPISLSYTENDPNILEGKIRGYHRIDYNWVSGHFFSSLSADVDIYKITTNNQQGVIVMKAENVPSNLKIRIEVFKFDGQTSRSEGFRDASMPGDSLRFELLTQYAEIYYIKISNENGNANGSGNTSPHPYTLKLWLDTLGNEFNNTPESLSTTPALPLSYDESNPNILEGKIRGYHRIDYNWVSGHFFSSLSADVDIYKITTNNQQGVIVMKAENVPSNLKIRIEVLKFDGQTSTSEGFRDASMPGDSLRFELLTQYAEIYYIKISNENGNANGSGNTSPLPYTLKLWLDTIVGENNNTPETAYEVDYNRNIRGKIRGHFRTDYNWVSGHFFSSLSADVDYYKADPNSCGTFLYARLINVPQNLRLKLTAFGADGTTILGTRTAVLNGDTVRLNTSELAGEARFFKVEAVNTGNAYYTNTSPDTYTLYLGYSPYANITSAFDTACAGSAVHFTAAANVVNNWSWNFGSNATPPNSSSQNLTVIFNSPGQQLVILSSNGCSSDSILLDVYPQTPIPSIANNNFTLSSSSPIGNQWYLNNMPIPNATDPTYNVTQNGTYHVCVSIPSSCGNPCSDTLKVISVGISEPAIHDLISLYPNPSPGTFTLTLPEGTPVKGSYSITDLTWRMIQTGSFTGAQTTVQLSVPAGIYFAVVELNGNKVVKRVVINAEW